jgi:hypothetical protein
MSNRLSKKLKRIETLLGSEPQNMKPLSPELSAEISAAVQWVKTGEGSKPSNLKFAGPITEGVPPGFLEMEERLRQAVDAAKEEKRQGKSSARLDYYERLGNLFFDEPIETSSPKGDHTDENEVTFRKD